MALSEHFNIADFFYPKGVVVLGEEDQEKVVKEVGGHFQEQFENFAIDGSKAKKEFAKKKKQGEENEKHLSSFFLLLFHSNIYTFFFSECSVEKCYANAEKFREGTYPFLLVGTPCPFSVQTIFGVGLPRAAHFKDTNGPGCKVWSMNRYVIMGEASEIEENIVGIKILQWYRRCLEEFWQTNFSCQNAKQKLFVDFTKKASSID